MTVLEQSKVNKVFGAGARTLSALDGLGALNEIVGAAQDCIRLHEVESTKRASIREYAETEVARIKAAEGVLKSYFEQVFAERRSDSRCSLHEPRQGIRARQRRGNQFRPAQHRRHRQNVSDR